MLVTKIYPKRMVHTLLLTVLVVSHVGCTPSMTKKVTISTDPQGAELYVSRVRHPHAESSPVVSEADPLGKAPVTTRLTFQDVDEYKVQAKLQEHQPAAVSITYEPKDRTQYHVKLVRDVVEVNLVEPEAVTTDRGVQLVVQPRATRAYLEIIERSPNARGVTRITNLDDKNMSVGGAVVSPVQDQLVYAVLSTDSKKGQPLDYIVQSGDTLSGIALAHNSYPDMIAKDNRLNHNKVEPGQHLLIKPYHFKSNIWKQAVGSAARTRVTYGNWLDFYPAFSSDGQQIFFSSNRVRANATLWRINTGGGGGITKVTDTVAVDYAPSVSGDRIAYASYPPNAEEPQVWTVHTDGSLPTQLREGRFPKLSPNGQRILYTRVNEDSGNSQIWVMNVDGTGETQLTQNTSYATTNPRWSPNGRWVVFASDEALDSHKNHNFDIWIMTADGGNKTQLTTNGSWDDKPCWSHDGKTIFFRSNRGGSWNIWSLNPVLP